MRVLALACLALLVFGCSEGETDERPVALSGGELALAHTGREDDEAVAALTAVVLEDLADYRVTLTEAPAPDEAVARVAAGELDAYQGVWTDAQAELLERHEGDLNLLQSWLVGKTRASLAAPDYLGVRSLDAAREAGAERAFVLDDGAFPLGSVPREVLEEHGLQAAYFPDVGALWREAEPLYEAREPFVVFAYSPSWANLSYELDYLEGEELLREFNEPHSLMTVARPGLGFDDPFAYALLDELKLTETQTQRLTLAVEEADSPEEGARRWLAGNETFARLWVEEARQRASAAP